MKRKIEQHLLANPSFFKWGESRLAKKYGCSVRTIRYIVKKLEQQKQKYLRNL
jgi:hypothetical protein